MSIAVERNEFTRGTTENDEKWKAGRKIGLRGATCPVRSTCTSVGHAFLENSGSPFESEEKILNS